MNYIKIYEDFIHDRRKHPVPQDQILHSQIHHVKPLWTFPDDYIRGGKHDLNNIGNKIRLSYADHLFAHLLLAKIYGKPGWRVVAFMIGSRFYKPGFMKGDKGRKRYDALCRLAEAGLDKTVYDFVHKGGERFSGTIYQLRDHIGKHLGNIIHLVNKKVKSTYGWRLRITSLDEVGAPKGERSPFYDHRVRDFIHRDGRVFSGTQYDFQKTFGKKFSKMSGMEQGKIHSAAGWRLSTTPLEMTGSKKAEEHSQYDPTKYHFVHRDGTELHCTMYELTARFGIIRTNLTKVIKGIRPSIQGWRLATTDAKRLNAYSVSRRKP